MANRNYLIHDQWTDDDFTNNIEVAVEDGDVVGVEVNGVPYGGGGGGGAEQIYITSATIEAGDTSTTPTEIVNFTVQDVILPENCFFYFSVRLSDDPQDSKYYGSDCIYYPVPGAQPLFFATAYYYDSNHILKGYSMSSATSGTGVWVSSASLNPNTDELTVKVSKKYSSTYSPNWSGDYDIRVYILNVEDIQLPKTNITPSE